MHVDYEQVDDSSKECAVIKATEMTENVKTAIDLLMGTSGCLPVVKGGSNILLNKTRIYYIESVDKKPLFIQKTSASSASTVCMSLRKCWADTLPDAPRLLL